MATQLKPVKVEDAAPSNLRFWEALSRTDPAHTKQFKRAGGFSGTALKPIWVEHMLTEVFGPAGIGWGMDKPEFQVIPGHNGEVLVFCTVRGWHGNPENSVYGVGGDKVVTYIKANEQYKRPERWENDDEAFKKAFTDATMNAFKHVGVGADIHMGLFDDSKYVSAMREEYSEPKRDVGCEGTGTAKKAKASGPYTTIGALKEACAAFLTDLQIASEMSDTSALDALMATSRELHEQVKRDKIDWWTNPEYGLDARIAAAYLKIEENIGSAAEPINFTNAG